MKKIIAVIAATIALAGCQPQLPVPQIGADGQPVPQQAQQDSGISPLGAGALGAAAGYMLGRSGSSNSTTVIDRSGPGYRPDYDRRYNRGSTVTTTTVKKGLFGGTKVTRSVRRSR